MHMAVRFTVAGEPQGKSRPRFNGRRAYTPAKTVAYENLIKTTALAELDKTQPLECAIALHVRAYFAIPQSMSKSRTALAESGDIRPAKKPDADNVLKAVADALNGVAWKDDAQIVTAAIEKFYSREPRLEVAYWPHSGKDLRLVK